MKNAVLSPLPFGSVVMEDGYLKNALKKEISYLLSLDDGRFLAGFYENAGIMPWDTIFRRLHRAVPTAASVRSRAENFI